MSFASLRLLHAGDLHLEEPLAGLADLPDHLCEAVVDAPLTAAKNVFDAALANAVDFVILSGDVIDPQFASPRAIRFLLDQFQRLAERNVPVYWTAGRVDAPEKWPADLPLPANVHVFPLGKAEPVIFHRNNKPVAAIVGTASGRERLRAGDYRPDRNGLFTVGVVYGDVKEDELKPIGLHYWSLGGKHESNTLCTEPTVAHYAGTPQGRSPEETGKRGCAVVKVDTTGKVLVQPLATEAIRWHHERIELDRDAGRDDLQRRLLERAAQLATSVTDRHQFVSWTISAGESLVASLRRGGLAEELMEYLRVELGCRTPALWTVSLEAELPPRLSEEWYEEDTILGDFLRSLQKFQQGTDKQLQIESLLPAGMQDGELAGLVRIDDSQDRQSLLREVALLGVDLLSGQPAADNSKAKIRFRTAGGGSSTLNLKHDGDAWKADNMASEVFGQE